VKSGIPPVDLRTMNGMARADESDGRKSVEGFFTFLYHFVAPSLHTTDSNWGIVDILFAPLGACIFGCLWHISGRATG